VSIPGTGGSSDSSGTRDVRYGWNSGRHTASIVVSDAGSSVTRTAFVDVGPRPSATGSVTGGTTCAEPDLQSPYQYSNGTCSAQTGSSSNIANGSSVTVSCITYNRTVHNAGGGDGGSNDWFLLVSPFGGYYLAAGSFGGDYSGIARC
jgi:hypothetical protein